MDGVYLKTLAYNSLIDLSTEDGINASRKDEVYGCIFGRDSALTILKILRVHSKSPSLPLLQISRRSLLTLTRLQGTELNKESGEAPGKFIHEFRKDKNQYLHLLNVAKPWYLYEDKTLRNYDSIDSTPLTLIAIYKYYQVAQDNEFLTQVLPAVEAGLNWMVILGDVDNDNLLEYELPSDRLHGGLSVHSWTDSHESLLQKDGRFPKYPIAPVETQGYAWLALRLWADFYQSHSPNFSQKLYQAALEMKKQFNKMFVFKDKGLYFAGQALDGDKHLIQTITGNPILLLWATYDNGKKRESILEVDIIPDIVKRLMMEDLFDIDAGIRTMSTDAATYNPNQDSYHNGSFWPILNGLTHEGLENWQFYKEARMLKDASLKPIQYFQTPIELYIKNSNGEYQEYCSLGGQKGCKVQAWSAAAILDFLTL